MLHLICVDLRAFFPEPKIPKNHEEMPKILELFPNQTKGFQRFPESKFQRLKDEPQECNEGSKQIKGLI